MNIFLKSLKGSKSVKFENHGFNSFSYLDINMDDDNNTVTLDDLTEVKVGQTIAVIMAGGHFIHYVPT